MASSSRLRAHRANAPAMSAADLADMDPTKIPEDDEEEENLSETDDTKEKPYMTESEANAAIADATAQAKADERARFAAVMASDNYAGREKLAATLLANDKMSADEIVAALGDAPAPAAATPAAVEAEDDDEKDRADMRAKLAAEQPGITGQAAEDAPEAQADTSLVDNMKARFGLTSK